MKIMFPAIKANVKRATLQVVLQHCCILERARGDGGGRGVKEQCFIRGGSNPLIFCMPFLTEKFH